LCLLPRIPDAGKVLLIRAGVLGFNEAEACTMDRIVQRDL
jgi:hypothetical protein